MTTFNNKQSAIIEAGKLVFITNGGSRELIGIRSARKQLAELAAKSDLRDSTADRLNLLRDGVALWDAR